MARPRRFGWERVLVALVVAVAGAPILLPAPVAAQGPKKSAASRFGGPVLRTAGQGATPAPAPSLGSGVRVNGAGKLHLAFRAGTPTSAAEESSLKALGATGVRSLSIPASLGMAPAGVIEAWVPRDKVDAAGKLSWVTSVGAPAYARFSPHGGSRNSAVLEAEALRAKGVIGTGVRVGVVSDGVQSLAAAQAAGELPAVTVVNQATVGLGDGNEGIAMLEIVHDMAPGAQLFFHAAGLPPAGPGLPADVTQVTLVNALIALANAGVNVIVHDVGFFDEPLFQQGIVAAVSDSLGRAGISVHSAAGNDGTSHAARVPAVGTGRGPDGRTGPFTNCSFDPDNVVAIAPNGDTTFDLIVPPGVTQLFALQWSEPRAVFPTATRGGFTDLDLFVMDENLTQCYGASDLEQSDGTGDTFEVLAGTSPFVVPTRVKLVVNVFDTSSAVAPPVIDLRWVGATAVDTPTAAGSVDGVNNFTSGLAAATGAWFGSLEPYSSRGPVELRLTTDCPAGTVKAALDPCQGVAGPAPQVLQSPAWVAPDRIPVSGAGGFPTAFTGTSASAPVAAGCDALVRQAISAPSGQVASVFARLTDGAHDIAPPGIDYDSGAGLLSCTNAAALAALRVQRQPSQTQAVRGATVDVALDVTNQGPDPAARATVVDVLPPGVRLASTPADCTVADGADGTQVLTCNLLTLAPGASRRIAFTVQVDPAATAGSVLTLNATLASAFDTTAGDNAAALGITVTAPLPSTGPSGLPQPAGVALAAAGLAGVALLRRTRAAT